MSKKSKESPLVPPDRARHYHKCRASLEAAQNNLREGLELKDISFSERCMLERGIQNINDMLSILEHFSLHVAPEGSDGSSTINSEAL